MTTIASLNDLVNKTSDWDKDERYMATNDLCIALSKDIKIDENMEQRICAAVLKQLDDPSNDVQSVAIKCLAIITKRVQQAQIGDICKKLTSLILETGKEALRDVYSIGLKTLIADVPDGMGVLVTNQLTARLLTGISRNGAEDIQRECLDNMSDLLKRFGHLMTNSHQDIMTAVVKQLQNEKAVIRKRAAHCLGCLVVVANDSLLNSLVQILLEGIEASSAGKGGATSQTTRTLIQTIGTVSRTVGYRLGKHLHKIVPIFLKFCGDPADESQQNEASNELRENCFPGLESFVLRCPREVSPFLQDTLTTCLAFLKYDPNYCYEEEDSDAMSVDGDDGDGENGNGDDEDDYYDEEQDGGGMSDDDDTSWKVRKAAAKVILATIQSDAAAWQDIWNLCAPALINRFKEREENVRLDVIGCLTSLIANQSGSASNGSVTRARAGSGSGPAVLMLQRQHSGSKFLQEINTSNQSTANGANGPRQAALRDPRTLKKLLNACCLQLGGNSVKTKSAVFTLLKALVVAIQGGLDAHLSKLLPLIEKCLTDAKNQTLKLEALQCLRAILVTHTSSSLQSSVAKMLPPIVSIVGEDWYKVIAEALRVLAAAVPVLRPLNGGEPHANWKALVRTMYKAVIPRLEALDIDQEIKECSLHCMSALFQYCGDELQNELNTVLGLYKRRLDNETTRTATLRALTVIAQSPHAQNVLQLSPFLTSAAPELALLLRQFSRSLKMWTLTCLDAIVSLPTTSLDQKSADALLSELANVVSDTDLHLTHLALKLAQSLALPKHYALSAGGLENHIYPKLLPLSRSAVLPQASSTQQALISLWSTLVARNATNQTSVLHYAKLFPVLYNVKPLAGGHPSSSEDANISKQGVTTLSKCIAGVLNAAAQTQQVDLSSAINQLIGDLQKSDKNNEKLNQLALMCLGEVGHAQDLSNVPGLKDLIMSSFASKAEDTKLAAAYALGHVACGNMNVLLPTVLQSLGEDAPGGSPKSSNRKGGKPVVTGTGKNSYLLLAALREIINVYAYNAANNSAAPSFAPYLGQVLPVLLSHAVNTAGVTPGSSASTAMDLTEDSVGEQVDNSVLSMVAECLGALTVLLPNELLPSLLTLGTNQEDAVARATGANSVRFALARQCDSATLHALSQAIPTLLPLLQDNDLDVKKAALLMVNTAVHHAPETIAAHLTSTVYPALIATLKIKLERVVDLGPFKHKVDDNLPLRKISLTCIETLLEDRSLNSNIAQLEALVAALPEVLADKDDVKAQAHQILAMVCRLSPALIVNNVESIIVPLQKTVTKKIPTAAGPGLEGGATGPEIERAIDLLKSCIRAMNAVNAIENIQELSRKWAEFYEKSKKEDQLIDLFRQVEQETVKGI